ncbi:ATP-dependent zinc metalloprotease FtsH [candidate division TA06 bacterium]|nr:ATP-dependent zinc metalloprotease FtsH [candidate division TA06 bacterium]
MSGMHLFNLMKREEVEISYSRFFKEVERLNVLSVTIVMKEIRGKLKEESIVEKEGESIIFSRFKTYIPFEDADLQGELIAKGVEVEGKPPSNLFQIFLPYFLPILLFFGLWFFLFRQIQSGPNKAFSFGKSRAKPMTPTKNQITFNDVAGVEEAKQELEEVVEFLKFPEKFQKLGGRIPKGILLLGPPGTGKTLLARAVAGEAGVPFFSISGSDFVELFVGVGASRVRDLFEQGKRHAPSIIFIDEIDAVGRLRGAGLGGGHDEREQTLNALLVEMDGFEHNDSVILLAATNRPDILDPALLRPGRFDRRVVVDRPDVKGREGILKVHFRKVPLSKDVDIQILARGTPGLSGADLANMVNEAALLAARNNRESIAMEDLESAKDKILMGTERKSLILSQDEKKTTAYHEAGHALVSKFTPGTDPIHKVTIIPRGMALGVTLQLPLDDRKTYSRDYCLAQLQVMLGGRAAELVALDQLTTGAGNDIEQATELARKMVCEWGMSDKMGPLTFGKKEEEIFLGREIAKHRDYSEDTARQIDKEVKRIVEEAEEGAKQTLKKNLAILHELAKALLEREILDTHQIDEIIRTTRGDKPPSDSDRDKVKEKVPSEEHETASK